ncbi:MAG: hypothetical protein PHQ36_04255 [Anaerolineales bacterium]|nr:hypothetical protein [Anaerolineales bacterium]
MAAGYDGTIRIDSSIDSKNFNAGIKRMITSVKALALSMGALLGIGGFFALGKASVDTAAEMSNAFIGLKSVMDGQGRSFQQAQGFIQSYIADGLVPLTNATAAYKNLAMRGYSTDQIEKTLIALKDSASFGRQGSLNMGQAIQGATEGLKNENSILVDNAGVTKNVSMMWKDYAASIGTTVGALTKEQKIQAEVLGVTEETRFQMGDASKLAGTYSGQVAALSVSFMNLKAAIGNALIPILAQIIPYIKTAMDYLTVFFNQVGQVVNALFGTSLSIADANSTLADNTNDAADAQGNLADNTKAAGKAARGALAAFDQLNVLQQGADAGMDTPTAPIVVTPTLDDTPLTQGLTELQQKVLDFKEKMLLVLRPVIDLWNALTAVFDSMMQALAPVWEWFWNTVLVPLGQWTGESLLLALKWMTERLYDFSKWIDENQTLFLILLGFFTLLGVVVVTALLLIFSPLAQFIALVLLIAGVFAVVVAAVVAFGYALVAVFHYASTWAREKFRDLAEWFQVTVIDPIRNKFSGMWEFLSILAQDAWSVLTYAWGGAQEWFETTVLFPLKNAFFAAWEIIQGYASSAWEGITKTFSSIAMWTDENISKPLKDGFSFALDWIQEKWESVFDSIAELTKGIVNSVIDMLNGLLEGVVSSVNVMIEGANLFGASVPDWVSIPTLASPKIPHLASGAVIPPNAQFLAVLGDQRSGRNIEAPEGLIRKIVSEEIGRIQADITVNFAGSLAGLVRELKPYIDKENVRVGGSLITSGATI